MIPTKAFVVAENGLLKTGRGRAEREWKPMLAQKPDVWCDLLGCAGPACPEETTWAVFGLGGPDVLPVAKIELRVGWPSNIY